VERTRELEGGIDVGFLNDRFVVDATLFSKRTSNALLEGLLPPSNGIPFQTIMTDGERRSSGVELAARARIVDAARVRADLGLTFTTLENELTSPGTSPPQVGSNWRLTPGYPLYGLWGRGFTVSDTNGDGVIVPAGVVLDTEPRYLGSPVPTRELALTPSLVFGRSLTVAALVDYRGGFRAVNSGGRLRCNTVCEPLYAPAASLTDQARAVRAFDANAPWIEDATFVRLREMSVAWRMPFAWSKRIGARSAGSRYFVATAITLRDVSIDTLFCSRRMSAFSAATSGFFDASRRLNNACAAPTKGPQSASSDRADVLKRS
jgi:hypothetical protein